jgi:hypothetical protein
VGKVKNSKKYHVNPLQNFDARPNHHRTGGRKSKTWDEIAFESPLFQPPIRLTWATVRVPFLSTGSADSRETKTKMHRPVAPVHWDRSAVRKIRTLRTFSDANGFFARKSTVSGPNSRIDVPVWTVRDTVGHSRFMAFLTTFVSFTGVRLLRLFEKMFWTPHFGYFSHKLRSKTGFQGYILALLTIFVDFRGA